jgi:hypothetical protein
MPTWGLWTSQTEWSAATELLGELGGGPRNYVGESNENLKCLLIYEILNINRTAEFYGQYGALIHNSYPGVWLYH